MSQKSYGPLRGGNGPRFDNCSQAANESEPFLTSGDLQRQAQRALELALLRRQRDVERVCRLGPRPVYELLAGLIRRHPEIETETDRQLKRLAGLDPEILAVVGGDKFPASPLRVVGGGR